MIIRYSKIASNTFPPSIVYRVSIREGDTQLNSSRHVDPRGSRQAIARNLRNWRRNVFAAWHANGGEPCRPSK